MDTDGEMNVRNGHEKESAELGNLGAVNEEEIQSATIVWDLTIVMLAATKGNEKNELWANPSSMYKC